MVDIVFFYESPLMVKKTTQPALSSLPTAISHSRNTQPLGVAPGRVIRGPVQYQGAEIKRLGSRPLAIAGSTTWELVSNTLEALAQSEGLDLSNVNYGRDCCESSLQNIMGTLNRHQADCILAIGGGKALDLGKLVAHHHHSHLSGHLCGLDGIV